MEREAQLTMDELWQSLDEGISDFSEQKTS